MILDIKEACQKDAALLNVVDHQKEGLGIFAPFIEMYPSWATYYKGEIYFIGGVLEYDGPLMWFFFDKRLETQTKTTVKMLLLMQYYIQDLYHEYDILVDKNDKKALRFAMRMGFTYKANFENLLRLRWTRQQ